MSYLLLMLLRNIYYRQMGLLCTSPRVTPLLLAFILYLVVFTFLSYLYVPLNNRQYHFACFKALYKLYYSDLFCSVLVFEIYWFIFNYNVVFHCANPLNVYPASTDRHLEYFQFFILQCCSIHPCTWLVTNIFGFISPVAFCALYLLLFFYIFPCLDLIYFLYSISLFYWLESYILYLLLLLF